jgi:hypothetical protein
MFLPKMIELHSGRSRPQNCSRARRTGSEAQESLRISGNGLIVFLDLLRQRQSCDGSRWFLGQGLSRHGRVGVQCRERLSELTSVFNMTKDRFARPSPMQLNDSPISSSSSERTQAVTKLYWGV